MTGQLASPANWQPQPERSTPRHGPTGCLAEWGARGVACRICAGPEHYLTRGRTTLEMSPARCLRSSASPLTSRSPVLPRLNACSEGRALIFAERHWRGSCPGRYEPHTGTAQPPPRPIRRTPALSGFRFRWRLRRRGSLAPHPQQPGSVEAGMSWRPRPGRHSVTNNLSALGNYADISTLFGYNRANRAGRRARSSSSACLAAPPRDRWIRRDSPAVGQRPAWRSSGRGARYDGILEPAGWGIVDVGLDDDTIATRRERGRFAARPVRPRGIGPGEGWQRRLYRFPGVALPEGGTAGAVWPANWGRSALTAPDPGVPSCGSVRARKHGSGEIPVDRPRSVPCGGVMGWQVVKRRAS